MSQSVLIFLVVVVSIFGGVALTALAVFFFFFYRAVKRLTEVVESLYAVIQPMSGGNILPDLLRSFQQTNKTGKDIVVSAGEIAKAVEGVTRMFHATQPASEPTAATAPEAGAIDFQNQDSFFVAPTEEEQAHTEAVEAARKAGMPTDEKSMEEPPLAGMVGSQV